MNYHEFTNYHEAINKAKLAQVLKDQDKYEFPEFFKIIRLTLGYSCDQVASFLDCSYQRVRLLESGKYGARGPSIDFITALSNFYSLDPYEMLKKFMLYMENPKRPEPTPRKK